MTIYTLTQHPDLQTKLRHELSAFGLNAEQEYSISESQYERMTMLNALLNEMMRLEPPLPITLRKTVRNSTVGNHAVKAGTYIVISPYAMGRSRAIWGPKASQFDPYRWITPHVSSEHAVEDRVKFPAGDTCSPHGTLNKHGGSLGNHQYGMLTFLKGPKGCTGERFAKAEMRRVIAALVAEFEWTSAQAHAPEQTGIVVVSCAFGLHTYLFVNSAKSPSISLTLVLTYR
jgi:cytochrome P450